MAKYDVVKRFQEVAKRAKEVGPIHTGGTKKEFKVKSKPKVLTNEKPSTLKHLLALDDDYHSRPGAKGRYDDGKQKPDVNLPIDTASQEVKDRMAKLRKK